MSYCPIWWSRSDSNRQHAITHNFGPSKCWHPASKRGGQESDCGIARCACVTPPRNAPRGGFLPPRPGPREPTIYGPLKYRRIRDELGMKCSTTELLRLRRRTGVAPVSTLNFRTEIRDSRDGCPTLGPEAGLEPATTRLGGDNPIQRPVEKQNDRRKQAGDFQTNSLSTLSIAGGEGDGGVIRDGIRTRDHAVATGCSPM